MTELFILRSIVAMCCCYFLLRNKIDFLLTFFLSTLLYHWMIVVGYIWVPPYSFDASPESMLILSIVLIALVIVCVVHDNLYIQQDSDNAIYSVDKYQVWIAYICAFISIFFASYSVILAGDKILGEKSEYLRAVGLPYEFVTHFPAAMALLFGVATRNKLLIFLSILPLAVYLFAGYRAVAVTAIVGVIVLMNFNRKIFSLRSVGIFFVVVSLFFSFAMIKQSYEAIKQGNFGIFDYVVEKDRRFDNYADIIRFSMFSAEFGQVSSNLSLVAELDLSGDYDIFRTMAGSIPLLNRIMGIGEEEKRFSTIIEKRANPGFDYGLGSTIWGETYHAGGYIGTGVCALAVCLMIAIANRAVARRKSYVLLFLYWVSFLAFYIHRNDLVLVIGNLKNILLLIVFSSTVILLFYGRIKLPFRVGAL